MSARGHQTYCAGMFVLMMVLSYVSLPALADDDHRIQPYSKNAFYWQYKGLPILLLGGSDEDNPFQWTGKQLTDHLDLLVSVGGNYIRNTMSDRDPGNVYAFASVGEGQYDLDQWSDEYWNRLRLETPDNRPRVALLTVVE